MYTLAGSSSSLSECVEAWVRTSIVFANVREIHVEIHGSTGFTVRESGGLGLNTRLLSSVGTAGDDDGDCRRAVLERISHGAGIMRVESREQGSFTTVSAVYYRGCRLIDVQSSMNGRQGTAVVVKDWHSDGMRHATRATVVHECRRRIENIALISQHVTCTVYCRESRRFVYKSVRGKPFEDKAVEFFGHVDPELLVPLQGHAHGWGFSGYAVLPPVGYATRSRQRVYVHSMLMENREVQDRIDALYMHIYQDNVKLLPPGQEVLRVKKSLHAHAMYILCIRAENMDARRTNQMPVWDEIMESVEACFLQAWRQSLSGRLIHVLERFANGTPPKKKEKMAMDIPNAELHNHNENENNVVLKSLELDEYRYRGMHRGLCQDGSQSVPTDDVSTPVLDNQSEDVRNYLSQLPKRRRTSSQSRNVVDKLISGWKNPVLIPHTDSNSSFHLPVTTVAHHEERCFKRLKEEQLKREDIVNCTIIGQIDEKFIAFKSASGNLGLVDQHAADERVRLEVLQSQVFLGDGHPNPEFVQSWNCPENLHVYVGQDEVELFDMYKTHANAWGWRWDPWCPSTKSIVVTHVPLIYHKALSAADLKLYIHQLVETSACRVAPQGCYRVLASIACRGAIMFGDTLTMDQSRALVRSLSSTIQYYECAHGRPTVTSLIHVPSLVPIPLRRRRGTDPSLESIRSNILSSL